MRARNIKPGFYRNENLAECSLEARFVFPGLWMLADKEGRLEYRPKRIKVDLMPFDNVDMEQLLDELNQWGLIKIYEIDGSKYIWIPKFLAHQNPHRKEKSSTIPRHPEDTNPVITSLSEENKEQAEKSPEKDSPLPEQAEKRAGQALLNPESLILNPESKNTVGSEAETNPVCFCEEKTENLSEQEVKAEEAPRRNNYPEDFDTFFRSWPHTNGSKKKAFAAWKKARDKPDLEKLLAMVDALKKSDKWKRGIIPHPETWLNGNRWETAELAEDESQDQKADYTPKEFDPTTLYGDDFDARKFYASA